MGVVWEGTHNKVLSARQAPLFGALQQIKTQLADANLTPEERSLLQFETLFGGTDRVHPAARSAGDAARCTTTLHH
jgi:hypothetical protein